MPTLNSTRARLEEIFILGWEEKTPIRFDNVIFDDKASESFVDLGLINYTTENVTIGSGITKRKRHIGVLSVTIFAEQNMGAGPAYAYADDVAEIMDNLSEVNLFTYASEVRRAGEEKEGGRYVLIVDVPYISDEV